MEIRFAIGPNECRQLDSEKLAENFQVKQLMQDDQVRLVYSHYDRVIVGGARPVNDHLLLPNHPELKAGYFLERRELGIINVGGNGRVEADGESFELGKMDCVYIGKGNREIRFSSQDKTNPALFYLLSSPAHMVYPNSKCSKE